MKIEDRRKRSRAGQVATCDVCHRAFMAARVTARYCSDRCKQKAYRDAQRQRREAAERGKRLQKSFALVFEKGG